MNCDLFFRTVNTYTRLSEASQNAGQRLLREESYAKGEKFVGLGEVPTRVGFVIKGLFSQNYVSKTGDDTIKYFFPEGRFAASVAAMLDGKPSRFSIVALENTEDSREPLLYDGECQQGRRASPHLSRFSQSTYLLLKP
jgi:hypothetical protein